MAETTISPPKKRRQAQSPVEECFDTLREAHDENVYGAIERLVQAGEQVGFTVHDLIRMLNTGITLEALFDMIEIRMMSSSVRPESRAASNN